MNKFIYQKDYPVVQTKEGALRVCACAALPETGTGKALGRSQRCTVLWLCEPAFASGTAGRKWRNDGSAYVLVRKRGLPELKYLDAVHSGWQETSGYGMAARRRIFSGVFHRTARL